tara:strand:+ start:363 stop:707 length:345 start_codon:yes stop_codon:yes gene_type:complete
MTENLYTIAIKNLLDLKTDMAMVVDGDSYESVVVEVDDNLGEIEKPTKEEVEAEVTRIKNILDTRKREYPTAAEWVIAMVQREVDNDPTEWNRLVERRSAVKNKYNQINSPVSE